MPEIKELQISDIITEAASWDLVLQEEQARLLKKYYELLITENKNTNLTRIVDPMTVLEEHFIDSLVGLKKGKDKTGYELLDLGSGAGFPGLPIKIYLSHIKLCLLDSSGKKIAFLRLLLKELKLEGVALLHQRAEDLGRGKGREAFSWVTARALAPLVVLLELALPLVKKGGYFWAFKGPDFIKEMEEAGEILRHCGGRLVETISYQLIRGQKNRNILIFKKEKKTDERFPRKAGIPQKRPLLKKDK
ncbi:MAG: 16S rRNA (guanine(527)-N(7))-methyltransferase RsmG [Dethiobacter sp.]|jgi:16S rRNA (guanine527-N7)-methyltransferase|nr:MAG: 16S rRNA (guanine(527)-N(7))-methyltransferase RsmG [Dethiobacter sp.]